jgi:hypothetical protein
MKNNLCMFCGSAGHKMVNCQKCLGNTQGKAAALMAPAERAADTTTSESKK